MCAVAVGGDGIAFGLHFGGEGCSFGGSGGKRFLVDLLAHGGAETGDEDVGGGGGVGDGDVAGGECVLEVGDGEGVFGVAGLLALDADAVGEREGGAGAEFAGLRDEADRLGLNTNGWDGQSEEECDDVAELHDVTVQQGMAESE